MVMPVRMTAATISETARRPLRRQCTRPPIAKKYPASQDKLEVNWSGPPLGADTSTCGHLAFLTPGPPSWSTGSPSQRFHVVPPARFRRPYPAPQPPPPPRVPRGPVLAAARSEERRVGKEGRSR